MEISTLLKLFLFNFNYKEMGALDTFITNAKNFFK